MRTSSNSSNSISLGSVSVASNGSPTASSASKTPVVPRFYDSEEEGAGGSLVFTRDNASLSRTPGRELSPRTMMFLRSSGASIEDGGSVVKASPAQRQPNRGSNAKENEGAGGAPQLLLPYAVWK